ncbi:VP1 [Slow loris parvovirus 1]|uniref:VP1 n=1 Tax=Slow loris parvovirus 1 TaxID=1581151 RepID=A0A0A7KU74_9VIRU|nr:VP1 [Slow loris parvovirus 1]AIZ50118.1 VP1 [Slow loris parvovirus 1]
MSLSDAMRITHYLQSDDFGKDEWDVTGPNSYYSRLNSRRKQVSDRLSERDGERADTDSTTTGPSTGGVVSEVRVPESDTSSGRKLQSIEEEHGSETEEAPQAGDSKRSGFVVPGYKYMGPGNDPDVGPPVNAADTAARDHDLRYAQMQNAGINPYVKYNKADEKMIEELKSNPEADSDLAGNAARAIWKGKERLTDVLDPLLQKVAPDIPAKPLKQSERPPPVQPIPPPPTSPSKRPSSPILDGVPPDKKPKVSIPSSQQEQPSSIVSGVGGSGMTEFASLPGSGGTTHAVDNWNAGCHFGDDFVITTQSRVCLLECREDKYVSIHPSSTEIKNFFCYGYKTPWSYIDLNRIDIHFTPHDWQTLTENYDSIKPVSLSWHIFHVNVKDVSTHSGDTTLADSAIGTVCSFTDDDYTLPYVLGNCQDTLPSYLPYTIYHLPQYAYCTVGGENPKVRYLGSFHVLEHRNCSLHRAGDRIDYNYEFPSDLPSYRLYAYNQGLFHTDNPLHKQYLWQPKKIEKNTQANASQQGYNVTWEQSEANDYKNKCVNFMPGPSLSSVMQGAKDDLKEIYGDQDYRVTHNTSYLGTGSQNHIQHRVSYGDHEYSIRPGPHGHVTTIHGNRGPVYDVLSAVGYTGSTTSTPRFPDESFDLLVNPFSGHTYSLYSDRNVNANAGMQPTAETMYIMPGMVWDDQQLHYESQIWAKIPQTDGHFHSKPFLGGWGLHNPPPMHFLKLLNVPGPPTSSGSPSILNQYCSFVLTYTIKWSVTKSKGTTQFNFQPKVTPPLIPVKGTGGDSTDPTPVYCPTSSGEVIYPDRVPGSRVKYRHM